MDVTRRTQRSNQNRLQKATLQRLLILIPIVFTGCAGTNTGSGLLGKRFANTRPIQTTPLMRAVNYNSTPAATTVNSCCSAEKQATCCDARDKEACCGNSAAGTCGCKSQ